MFAPSVVINLYTANICRLCCEENENGRPLYCESDDPSVLINKHLPVKVADDGILPRWICPGCFIQVESTAQFFDRIVSGQERLQRMAKEDDTNWTNASCFSALDDNSFSFMLQEADLANIQDPLLVANFFAEDNQQMDENITAIQLDRPEISTATEPLDNSLTLPESTPTEGELLEGVHNENEVDVDDMTTVAIDANAESSRFICDVCEQTFSQEWRYLKHLKEHSIAYECSNCMKQFALHSELAEHQRETGHTGKGVVEGIADISKQHNESASDVKRSRNFPCTNCNQSFTKLSALTAHTESAHNIKQSFICSTCGKCFMYKKLLQRHLLTHSGDRPHACTVCEASFKTRSHLHHHSLSHRTSKDYRCTVCDQRFSYKANLRVHLRVHSGEKPHICSFCPKRFAQRGNLEEHQRIHLGIKPYRCSICSRTFTTSSQHKLHQKRHTDVRPHQCQLCGKSFLLLADCRAHVRRHTDERPYRCTRCDSAFAEKASLTKHFRTHTVEKPYACAICEKTFADYSNCRRHALRLHAELDSETGGVFVLV